MNPDIIQKPASALSLFLNEIHPLSQDAITTIDREVFYVNVPKGRFLAKPGLDKNFYLILKGVMRAYVKIEGKEITTWISEENEIAGSINGLITGEAGDEYIQALEETECVGIPAELVQYLFRKYPETNVVGRILLEHCYRNAEERAFITRIPSAEKRYKRFIATRPLLVERISLKYIASYLNMTLETISRVGGRKTLIEVAA